MPVFGVVVEEHHQLVQKRNGRMDRDSLRRDSRRAYEMETRLRGCDDIIDRTQPDVRFKQQFYRRQSVAVSDK